MDTRKLILTGVLGVALSVVLMFSIAVFIVPTLHVEKTMAYKSTDLAKQFELAYPEYTMITNSGNLYEQHTSFTYFKNARYASLTFTEGINGENIVYKCERIISSQDPVEIFYFENPTTETIKNNICGPYD